MKIKFYLASTIAFASAVAQATTGFSHQLSDGINTISIGLINDGGTSFQEDVMFTLANTSKVTGTLTGVSGLATLSSVSALHFTESGNAPLIQTTPIRVGDSYTFDLGQLWAPEPGMVGFDSGLYTLYLSGFRSAGVTGLQLSLNVTSVPEPSTWVMLALGFAGLAGVNRVKKLDGKSS